MSPVVVCVHCGAYARVPRSSRTFAFGNRCPECALPRHERRRLAS